MVKLQTVGQKNYLQKFDLCCHVVSKRGFLQQHHLPKIIYCLHILINIVKGIIHSTIKIFTTQNDAAQTQRF